MNWTRRPILLAVLGFVRHPWLTLAVCGIILAGALWISLAKLSISSNQNELFSPKAKFFRDYLEFTEKFPENEAAYVLVAARDPKNIPPVERWTAAADQVAAKLSALREHVKSVDARVPLDGLGNQGLLFETPENVRKTLAEVRERFVPQVKLWAEEPSWLMRSTMGPTPIQRFLAGLHLVSPDAETAAYLKLLADSWIKRLESPAAVVPNLAGLDAGDPSRLGYYYVPDQSNPSRNILLVRAYPAANYTSLTASTRAIGAMRAAVKQVAGSFPEFTMAMTGRPVLEADEMQTTDRDSQRAEIVALTAVFIGLVILLRSFWLALAAELGLGVGIGWTFGWATLSVGRLNLLSIVFLLALIGIGMDYLVQILSRYRHEITRRRDPRLIWIAVFRQVGAPINTACLGAAGAFLVAIFTDFRGAAELGIIAGGGLLICLLAGYTFLPALLTLLPAKATGLVRSSQRGQDRTRSGWHRAMLPLVWAVLLVAGITPAMKTRFDPGLLELQAQNLESVQLVRKLETWFAVVLTKDLAALRAARDAVADSPVVARTESILSAIDNQQWLAGQRDQFPKIQWTKPTAVQPNDLGAIAKQSRSLARRFRAPTIQPATGSVTANPALADAAKSLDEFANRVDAASAKPEAAQRLSQWQESFVDELKRMLLQFDPPPLEMAKVPPELRNHLLSDDGNYALYLYPREDLWRQEHLARFVQDIEGRIGQLPAKPTVTGIASNIHHTTASIRRSFFTSTFYAVTLIFVLVLIDMRRLSDTLLAVSVLALGLPMLVAVMGLIGVNWNFANFFGLPILIGAAHEYGVFMVHRYREVMHDPRRAWRGWDVADKALLLCAFITSSSFGFFWLLGHHEGLRSLGMVMAVGSMCIYFATILVLRPLLKWKLARNGR